MIDKLSIFRKAFSTIKRFNGKDDNMDNIVQEERSKHANSVIRNHVIWSMGAGFIPLAIADVFAVSAVQLDMIKQLSRVYNLNFKETEGKALITALSGSALARVGASAIKLIPGLGSVIGGMSMSLLSGAATYALGQVFSQHFKSGGTFLDFDPGRMKAYYEEQFEKGKKVAKDWKDQAAREESAAKDMEAAIARQKGQAKPASAASDNLVDQLQRLAQMRDNGVITEEEFIAMKQKLID